MKKISLAVTFLFAAAIAIAQSAPKFGIKGGVNVASIDWNRAGDSRIGFHAGLLAHIHLSKEWGIQPEVLYSREGTRIPVTDGKYTFANDYINIPLMLQYMFNNGFRLEAGPQLGLLVNSDNEDLFKSTNIGLGFGLNYLSYSGLGLGARYNLGLNRITENIAPEGKGRNLQISLFYMFDNNHKSKSR